MANDESLEAHYPSLRYRLFVLALLFFYSALNFVDRQIVGILATPIKSELKLSDTELGLLGGVAFTIVYSVLALPVAVMADRSNRGRILTAAIAIWSSFTVLCGFTSNFIHMFFSRLGVGVGEAGGTAPAYSIISDYFPASQRGRAVAVYLLGIPIGSAIGLALGGVIAAQYGWRTAFFFIGAVGILLTPLIWIFVREPRDNMCNKQAVTQESSSFLACIRLMAGKPTFWFLSLAMSASAMLLYGLGFWMPSFLQRSHGLSLQDTALFFAAITLVGGVVGTVLGGWLGDHLGSTHPAFYAYVPGIGFFITLPFFLLGLWIDRIDYAIIFLVIPQICGLIGGAPIVAAIQKLGPASMRTTIFASYLFVVSFVGQGLGTLLMGKISDYLSSIYGMEGLRYSMMVCGVILYPLTSFLFYKSGRCIERDIHSGI